MMRLVAILCLLPFVASAQFGAFERDFIVAKSNFTAQTSITLGGVTRTTWPDGGAGDAVTNSASEVSGLTLTTSGGIVTLGGSIPASGLTTNEVNALIGSTGSNLFATASITSNLVTVAALAGATNTATLVPLLVSAGVLTNGFAGNINAAGYTVVGYSSDDVYFAQNTTVSSLKFGASGYQFNNTNVVAWNEVVSAVQTGAWVTASVTNGLMQSFTLNGEAVTNGSAIVVSGGGGGGSTNVVWYHLVGDITTGSTCTRVEQLRYTRFATNTCSLYLFGIVLPATTNAQEIGAWTTGADATFEWCASAWDGTTNVPTSFTVTNTLAAVAGAALSVSNAVTALPTGVPLTMRVRWTSGGTNLLQNLYWGYR